MTRRTVLTAMAGATPALASAAPPGFDSTWDSLRNYRCPEWFRDAKFGIFLHWGPQSVPGVDAWYARNMYVEGHAAYRYHVKTYGHPSRFGFKDICALWKAERFDADSTIAAFKLAGAKYIVPVAVHHDNFDCWDSRFHRWNSMNVGPRKDIVGLWRMAALKHGLRFGVSEHLERSWSWLNTCRGSDKKGPLAGIPYDGNDAKYTDLYFEPHQDTSPYFPAKPLKTWVESWSRRIKDLVDRYQPDLLYTDGGVPFGAAGRDVIAHFYNGNLARHGGTLQAVYNAKNFAPRTDHGEFVEGICVQDFERGVLTSIRPEPWQTDTCIGQWFYYSDEKYKSATAVLHTLLDIISKNGNLLLNIPLKPDGTMAPGASTILDEFAAWMRVNAEAVHGTRPWEVFGEGPTQPAAGQFKERTEPFTAEDIRFTRKGGTLYASVLGIPGAQVAIKALASGSRHSFGEVRRVELLGHDQPLKFARDADSLSVQMPEQRPAKHALVLKIRG